MTDRRLAREEQLDINPGVLTWVIHIPGVSRLMERLGVTECRRRLLHMCPAFLPLALLFIPHGDVWGPFLMVGLAVVTGSALTIALAFPHWFTRDGECEWKQTVLGYAIPVLIPLFFLPGRAELGLLTLEIVALGDGSATLGGLLCGGPTLPWNRKKTFVGLLCFTLVGSIAATCAYWPEAHPQVSVATAYLICLVAAFCAGVVESLPIKSSDNLRVGSTALLVGFAMSAWLTM